MLHFNNASLMRNALRIVQVRGCVHVSLNEQVNKNLEDEVYKPKDQPGRVRMLPVELPGYILDAIDVAMDAKQLQQLRENGVKLDRYLWSRHVPMEDRDIIHKKNQIKKELLKRAGASRVSDLDAFADPKSAKDALNDAVAREYYQKNYNWKPIVYDSQNAWNYLFGRATKEYAALLRVFSEIAKRDPDFKPRSFFDFGAGIGTGTWAAANLWRKSLYEYFVVDESRDMNDLSELLLRDGNMDKKMALKNVFYRQFLPAQDEFKSHLVLSAFSFNEFANMNKRIEVLMNLWNKCDGYFVMVENGTQAGFKLIEEAREFLIQQTQKDNSGYLFAPCPHESMCPRILKDDRTPCNFTVNYRIPELFGTKRDNRMLFSYVIFKKSARSTDETINWPRVVRPTQVRTRHTRCKLCTHRGKLEDLVITKNKHSKYTYRCARKSDWGDRLPYELSDETGDSVEVSEFSDDEK